MNLPRNLDTAALQEKDNLVVHPWEDITKIGAQQRTIVEKGDGIYVTDSDGNRLIDAPAGMWCVNLGHGREEIINAMAEQARDLSYFSPWSIGTVPAALLAEKLGEHAPGDLKHVSFSTGGSTAVDTALRFAFFYNNVLGRPEKKHIISRIGAYHGSTYLSATCAGKMAEKAYMDMADDLVTHLPCPKPLLRPAGMSLEAFCDQKVADLENAIEQIGPDRVAAFIAEPVQASGGVIIPPAGYHARCLEVCRKHDVLYISDEVVTAFGRLGHVFASEPLFGIVPDIITTAKGLTSGYLPMGATLISDRLLDNIKASGAETAGFNNGFTYSGHPVSAAAGLKTLEILERERLCERVREIAPFFAESLGSLNDYPVVSEVRAIGLMAGIEFNLDRENPDEAEDSAFTMKVIEHCERLGMIVRPIANMCVMSPPLIISEDQIRDLTSILHRAIDAASQERQAA